MSTVQEIAAAVDLLPADEKEELLRFLAVRLRKDRAQQPPHLDSAEEVATMAAEDGGRGRCKPAGWLQVEGPALLGADAR
jgi:hypothetical protein